MGSVFSKLNIMDALKGALVAALAIIITGIGNILQTGVFPNWDSLVPILLTGLSAFLAYIMKALFTNSAGQTLTPESNVVKNVTEINSGGNKVITIEVKK